MSAANEHNRAASEDEKLLQSLGYKQELARRMSGFSNFAISLSIICILAGGITSFQVGLCSAGGASIGLGWPLACLFSMAVALAMAQVASAFPTAGGLYHWGSILGGKACGWAVAWFNLLGLVTVLAAINGGAYDFALSVFGWIPPAGQEGIIRTAAVSLVILSQGLLNHYGIRLTTRLTDLSGWLILAVSAILIASLLIAAPHLEWARLWTFENFSGLPKESPVFPRSESLPWIFALGLLLPAYTITGFDASAHTSEETIDAARNVPKGIIRSVWVSGLMGWALVASLLLAMPSVSEGVSKGGGVVQWIIQGALPAPLAWTLLGGILITQYGCGLAALTSASRMTYAFARDRGLPASGILSSVSPATGTPSAAIWAAAILGAGFTIFVPYVTIAAACTVFLYISYVLPIAAGFFAYGKTWTRMGPFELGAWYRPLAVAAVIGCLGLIAVGMQPPNEQAVSIVGGSVALMAAVWFGFERRRFKGPPTVQLQGPDAAEGK